MWILSPNSENSCQLRIYLSGFSLAPKTSSGQPGILYESHNYAALGAAADFSTIMTYEWGYKYGPPMAVAPLNKVRGSFIMR